MLLSLQYRVAVIAAALAVALALGFWGGWRIRAWQADAEKLLAMNAAAEARQILQQQLQAKSAELETVRAELDARMQNTTVKIREIYRDRPIPSDCAAPPAARSLLISLGANGAPAAGAGEPPR